MRNHIHLNKTLVLFGILLLISSIENHQSKNRHLCVHDEKQKLQPVYVVEEPEENSQSNQKRVLQATTPQSMRVTFNYDRLDGFYYNDSNAPQPYSGSKQQLVEFIKKQTQATQEYIARLIKIVPPTIIKFQNVSNATCGGVSVPSQDIVGLNNSDLNIYVNYEYNTTSNYLAYASQCIFQGPLYRPTFGYITYNFAYQNTTNFTSLKEFEDQLEVTIHELTHVLGFSSFCMQNYWYDPQIKNTYKNGGTLNKILLANQTYRGRNTTNLLASQRVRDYAREYYNCSTLPGMQLENEGSEGSLGSHWERVILENEYMTASAITSDAAFSKFTSFLLLDTGWYDYVDLSLADEIQWGKNKGCKFFDLACKDNTTQYSEFSYVVNETKCTYDYNGIGIYSTGDTFDDDCPYISQWSNTDCSNDQNYQDPYWNRSQGMVPFTHLGWNSRCFNSTLYFSGYQSSNVQRCYQFNCLSGGSTLQIILDSNHTLNCTQNGQVFNVTGYTGQVNCPNNIQEFCGVPNYCPNFCNSNGICLNEVCHCFTNYAGEDCSIFCNSSQYIQNSSCVSKCPTGYAPNPANKQCQECTIVQGYFYNSQTSTCEQCYYGCKTCQTSNDICTSCDQTRILVQNISCMCRDGFYEAQQPFCLKCGIVNCKNCDTGYATCQQCLIGFYLDPFSNVSKCLECRSPCLECINMTDYCTSCITGYFLFYNSSTQTSSCVLTCPTGYYNLIGNQNCNLCDQRCQTCQNNNLTCTNCRSTDNRILNSNSCVCLIGYFEDPTNFICSQCSQSCASCSGTASNCTSCLDGFLFNDTQYICTACFYRCKTCTQNIDTCITCDSTRNISNNCVCNQGYYEKQQASCGPCPQGCTSCTDSNVCQNCSIGYNLVNQSCIADCLSNQFLLNQVCTNCSSTCLTCQTTSTFCLTCNSALKFFNNTCVQTCPSKTVLSSVINSCVACYERCENCINSTDICTSCNTLQFRKLMNSACVCQDGYYDDNSQPVCKQCSANCQLCQSNDSCISCVPGFFYQSTSLVCEPCFYRCLTCTTANDICATCDSTRNQVNITCLCKDGYFETQKTACTKCNIECGTCSNNASNCITCATGYNFTNNNLCTPILNCTSKQYIQNGTCFNCSTSCATCSYNASFCQTCASPLKLFNNTCISTCPNGTISLSTAPTICQQCNFKCLACANTQTQCTTCNLTLNRKLLNNTCICVDGYWDDNANTACRPCKEGCATCNAQDICLTCRTSYVKDNTSNCVYCDPNISTIVNSQCVCNSGFYLDSYSKKCTKCYYRCKTCTTSNDICSSCESTRVQVGNSCNCLDGYYEDYALQSIQCIQCPIGCQTCTVQGCLTCQVGFYFDSTASKCYACSLGCNNCTNSTVCLGCQSPQFTLNATSNTCYSNCLTNQYIDQITRQCFNCSSQCKQCSLSSDNCTACIAGLNFYNNSCLQSCPPGYVAFIFLNNSICNPCIQSCKTCSLVEKNCTACNVGFFLQFGTSILYNECVYQCKPGFFADSSNNQCTQCDKSCLTCYGKSTNCTACVNSTLFLSNGSCQLTCLANQYSYQKICYNCETQCKTCAQDSNLCTSCASPNFLINQTCIDKCPDGFFGDASTFLCQKCYYLCSTCSSATQTSCLTCITGFNQSNGACLPKCNITIGQYFDNVTSLCGNCSPNCLTCFGGGTNQCLSCKNQMFLDMKSNICVQTCSQSSFNNTLYSQQLNINITVCQPCAPNCLTCNGPTPKNCLSCDPTKYFTFDVNTCFCNQYDNRIFNNATNACTCSQNSYPLNITDSNNLQKQVCSLTCPLGQYGTGNSSCYDCDRNYCTTCFGEKSNCTSCANNTNQMTLFFFNITFGTCVSQCPQNYLNQSNVCLKCHESCQGCQYNLMNCTNCAIGFSTFNYRCVSQAQPPYGYFFDKSTSTFKACNIACTSCFGADFNQCYACNIGYTLQSNTSTCIQQCPTGCTECLKNYDQYCLKCAQGFQLQILNPAGMQFDTLLFPGQCVPNCSILSNTSNATNTSLQQQTTSLFFFGTTDRCIIKCPEIAKYNNLTHCQQNCSNYYPYYFPTNFTCVKSCPFSFINTSKACVDFCPMNTYKDNLTRACFDCHQSCLTCSGSLNTSCTSCPVNYFLTGDNLCVNSCSLSQKIFNGICLPACPSNTFSNAINTSDQQCYQCHPSCGTCSGSNNSNSCLTCSSPNLYFTLTPGTNNLGSCLQSCPPTERFSFNMKCVNTCPAGYYPNSNNFQCQPCMMTCKTCSSFDKCTSCLNDIDYIFNNSTGICNLKITCPGNCFSCQTSNDCQACLEKYYLYNNSCVKICPNNTLGINRVCNSTPNLQCPDGQFRDYQTNICTPCSSKCITCTNETVCQSCAQGFTFSNYQCLDNNICASTCAKCNGPLENNCTLCIFALSNNVFSNTPLFLYRESVYTAKCIEALKCPQFAFIGFNNNTCVDVCPDGLYPDLLSKLCKRCNSSCLTCSGPSDKECNSCILGMDLITGENYCVKNTSCYPSCLQCTGPQKNQCISCISSSYFFYNNECVTSCPSDAAYLLGGKCLANCPTNYYINPTNNYCTLCPRGCDTCLSATQCLTCKQFYTYNSTSLTCQVVCGEGTYMSNDSTGSITCLPCSQTCAECTDNTTCLKCAVGYFKSNSQCVPSCPSNSFGNYQLRTCDPCNSKCLQCKASSEFSCLSCSNSSDYLLFSNSGSQCVANCPSGYFGISNFTNPYDSSSSIKFCQICSYFCKTCDGPSNTNCTSCANDLFFNPLTRSCVKFGECNISYYPEFSNMQCQQCNDQCLTCAQIPTWCTQCKNQTQFLYRGNCYDACSDLGSYYNYANNTYKTCLPCHSTCLTCTGSNSNQCLTCDYPLIIEGSSCVSNCSLGQFRDTDLGCVNCATNCKTCYSIYDTACTSCNAKFFLNYLQQCVSQCDSGYYADITQGMCKSCDFSCLTCQGTYNNCTSCPESTYIQGNTCVLQCSDKYYMDQTSLSCLSCHSACKTCFGPLSSQCLACSPNFYLSGYSCLATCPNGQFGSLTNKCQLCHSSCLTCTDSTDSSCWSCRTGYILQLGKCVIGCPSYLLNSLPNCYRCDSVTSKCLNCNDEKTFFVNSTGQCAIINCDLMSSSSICKSCKIGFGLSFDSRYCIDNSINTLKCARYDLDGKTCKDCISGWGLDPISKQCSVNLTVLTIPGCTKYINNNAACTECSTFYGLKDQTCIDNSLSGSILYCKEYQNGSDPLVCIKCQQDYGLNTADKKCFQLTYIFVNNNLALWNSAGKYGSLDATCPPQYTLYNEGCVLTTLIQNCTTYFYDRASSQFKCKSCQAGLVPSISKDTCIVEIPGCYAYDGSNACISCNKPLTYSSGTCISQYSPGQFIGCKELVNNICQTCWTENNFNQYPSATTGQCECISGNQLNSPINNAQWYCTQVKAGCSDPTATNCTCKTYMDLTKCKECWSTSYMLSPDSTQCLGPYNSAKVNCSYQWKTGSCFQCKTGQILISTYCKLIPSTRANYLSLCAEANSNFICTRCKIGYKLNSTSTTTPCYQTTSNGRLLQVQQDFLYSYCAQYDENRAGYCLYCQSPQIAIDGVCYDRLAYCDQQNTPYSCDSCYSGFYLKADGTCEKNPENLVVIENCLKYDQQDFTRCSVCTQQALLSNSGKYCLSNCEEQDQNDPSKCNIASQNYVSISGIAILQTEAIKNYEKANQCSSYDVMLQRCVQCQKGYGLFQGSCVSNALNVPNCQEYTPQSLQECSVCQEGYIPVKGNTICYFNVGASKVIGCNKLSQDYDGTNNYCDPLGCDSDYVYDLATKTCIPQQQLINIDNNNQNQENNAESNKQKDQKTQLSASYIALIVIMTLIAILIIGVVVVIIKKKQKLIQTAKIRPINQNESHSINNSNQHNSTLGIINNN